MDESSQRWGADLREEFDRFHGLEAANNAWEHAQDTCFRSCGHGTFGRRFGKKAAVAWASEVWGKDGDLAFKLVNGTVDEGLLEKVSGVVCGEAGGKVIGAIEEGIVIGEEVDGIVWLEAARVKGDFNVRVDFEEACFGAFEFGGADRAVLVKDLAVEVGVVNVVWIDEANVANSCGSKVKESGRAEPTSADAKDGGCFESLLASDPDFWEHGLAQVAVLFILREWHGGKMSFVTRRIKERLLKES